jgi:Recombinase
VPRIVPICVSRPGEECQPLPVRREKGSARPVRARQFACSGLVQSEARISRRTPSWPAAQTRRVGIRMTVRSTAPKAQPPGLTHPRSGRRLMKAEIHRILQNPIYTGDFRWHGKLFHGSHGPLISRDTFVALQAVLNRIRCYRTARSIAEVFVRLTKSHSICSLGRTKLENGGPSRTRTCDLLVRSRSEAKVTVWYGVFLSNTAETKLAHRTLARSHHLPSNTIPAGHKIGHRSRPGWLSSWTKNCVPAD